jgi:hypothetical protein
LDSFPIMLDNQASKCLTNAMSDFITPPKYTSFSYLHWYSQMVFWRWQWKKTQLHVAGDITSCPWTDTFPPTLGSGSKQQHSQTLRNIFGYLWWLHRAILGSMKIKKTVSYCPRTNVEMVQSAPRLRLFQGFCTEVIDDEPPLRCFSNVVSDDKNSNEESFLTSCNRIFTILYAFIHPLGGRSGNWLFARLHASCTYLVVDYFK